MENNYIVYKHTCPNGKCYIGITGRTLELRWNYGHGYDTQFFGKAVKKYGVENIKSEILHENLTYEEALAKEIEEIANHKSNNPHFGYNCTIGGEAVVGYVITEECRKQRKKQAQNLWSDPIIKAKLLAHLKELNEGRIGKKMDREAVRKSALARGKAVDQYSLDGKYISTFPTAMDAARAVGKKNNSDIVSCCKGRRSYAQGFIWRYADPNGQMSIVESTPYHGKRKVNQLTKSGEYIQTFNSVTEGAIAVGGNVQNIQSCIKGRRATAYGYKWEYADTVS